MAEPPLAEELVARVVVNHLEGLGADVYQEVEVPGGIADIVALFGSELWVVEVKAVLSLKLITQAMGRRGLANRVVIAAPTKRRFHDAGDLCREIGLGLWRVHLGNPSLIVNGKCWDPPTVNPVIDPTLRTKLDHDIRPRLSTGHKTHAKAGAVGGGRWTKFRATCEEIARVVAAQPGITLKVAVETANHHYRTKTGAISSLAHWIHKGKVPGVRGAGVGGETVLQPEATR